MKLSEVIKAIEDGSKSEFVLNEVSIKFVDGVIKFNMFNRSGYFETNANWEEVKPPRQWSEKELMLFKLLPKNANWIAKDSDGYMTAFDIKPTKYHDKFIVADSNSEIEMFIDGFDFLTITFEESPIYIGDLKGE